MSALSEEENAYVQKYQSELQIAIDNTFLLLDPTFSQKQQDLFYIIEHNQISDKFYLFQFIINTCTIVDGLDETIIKAVTHYFKIAPDEDIIKFSKLIQDAFFSCIDVKTTGQIQHIWIELFSASSKCIGLNLNDEIEINDQKISADTTEKSETEPIDF